MITERPWYDNALLAYLAIFFLLEAVSLRRESGLGWAMLIKCLSLSFLFTYGLLLPILLLLQERPWVGTLARVSVALGVTGAIVEMWLPRKGKMPPSVWIPRLWRRIRRNGHELD